MRNFYLEIISAQQKQYILVKDRLNLYFASFLTLKGVNLKTKKYEVKIWPSLPGKFWLRTVVIPAWTLPWSSSTGNILPQKPGGFPYNSSSWKGLGLTKFTFRLIPFQILLQLKPMLSTAWWRLAWQGTGGCSGCTPCWVIPAQGDTRDCLTWIIVCAEHHQTGLTGERQACWAQLYG